MASDWEPIWVVMTMVLATPEYSPVRISTFSGAKTQAAWSGRPEQESVTNAGPLSAATYDSSGTTVTVAVPDWPGVKVFGGVVVGARLETVTAIPVSH
jgi:hypothetical protein